MLILTRDPRFIKSLWKKKARDVSYVPCKTYKNMDQQFQDYKRPFPGQEQEIESFHLRIEPSKTNA